MTATAEERIETLDHHPGGRMDATEAGRLATWSDTIAARLAWPGDLARGRWRAGLPRRIGSIERGTHLLEGRYRLGGHLVERPGVPPWDVLHKVPQAAREAHGFGWLDDLMAVPFPEAEELARHWTGDWVARFGRGAGPGWTAALAGRRALAWVFHGEVLRPVSLAPTLARHAAFLKRRAATAPPALGRVEAATGLVHAAVALEAEASLVSDAVRLLEASAGEIVLPDGGVASRNPAELAHVLALLGWTLEESVRYGIRPGDPLLSALSRGVAALRAIVHPGGRLPAFHGGNASPGLADVALTFFGHHRLAPVSAPPMGYARLRHGGTSVVIDVAAPPLAGGHASTLAVEASDGRTPIFAGCGSGTRYGSRWSRAARATASHSVLGIEGYSSSRIGGGGLHLAEIPRRVECRRMDTPTGTRLATRHDGYGPTHGLIHHRHLELTRDGRRLRGEDSLVAETAEGRRRLDRARSAGPVAFAVRFHLDPSIEPSLDAASHLVWLRLETSRLWAFRLVEGHARLAVESSVVFPEDALEPNPTYQVVLFSSVVEYATRLTWELAASSRIGSDATDDHGDETER
jgi:uncharacterized heparinase superfamily protein